MAIVIIAVTGMNIVRKETIQEMQQHNEQLKFQLEDLIRQKEDLARQKEILEEILLRDKRQIQKLEEEIEELRVIRARVTAYSPSQNISGICADDKPGITATGTIPKLGVAAADPKKLPYGTEISIPGYGLATIEDTGAALRRGRGLRLDVVLPSHEEAMAWGVQEIDIKIEKWGES